VTEKEGEEDFVRLNQAKKRVGILPFGQKREGEGLASFRGKKKDGNNVLLGLCVRFGLCWLLGKKVGMDFGGEG